MGTDELDRRNELLSRKQDALSNLYKVEHEATSIRAQIIEIEAEIANITGDLVRGGIDPTRLIADYPAFW
jgi:hypothetical protein